MRIIELPEASESELALTQERREVTHTIARKLIQEQEQSAIQIHIFEQRKLRNEINWYKTIAADPIWQEAIRNHLSQGKALSSKSLGTPANEQVFISQVEHHGDHIYPLPVFCNILHCILQAYIDGKYSEAKVSIDIINY